MSSGILDLGIRVPKSKRVYSKGGCRECKRRKIKCDEGKPYCWQCVRLRKECSYPVAGEKVLRVSKKQQGSAPPDLSVALSREHGNYQPSLHAQHLQPPQHHQHNKHSQNHIHLEPNKIKLEQPPNHVRNHIPNRIHTQSIQNINQGLNQTIHNQQISQNPIHHSQQNIHHSPPNQQVPIHGQNLSPRALQHNMHSPQQPPSLSSQHSPVQNIQKLPVDSVHHPINHHPRPPPLARPLLQSLSSHHQLPQLNLHSRVSPQQISSVPVLSGPTLQRPLQPSQQNYHPGQQNLNLQSQHNHHNQQNEKDKHEKEQTQNELNEPNLTKTVKEKQRQNNHIEVFPPPDITRQHADASNETQSRLASRSSSQSQSITSLTTPKYTSSSIANLLNDMSTPLPTDSFKNQSSSSLSNTFSTSPHSIASTTPTNNNEKFHAHEETVHNPEVFSFFDQEDLNLLASDLNNIVSNIMYESNFEDKFGNHRSEGDYSDNSFKSTPTSHPQQKDAAIPRNIPFDFIKVKKSHEKLYLEEFYNEFSQIILPFSPFDANSKKYFNPARDIILRSASNESFLLAAVLAQGAKLSFQKNNVSEDEGAYCNYLAKCLKLLGPALESGDMKRGAENLNSNIESVLLTVLLLTAANASNSKQDWRPHLKGAKDILLKTSAKTFKNSNVLIFCKSWFVTLEILAGTSSKLGGTLTSEEEIDSLITSDNEYETSVLKELGLVLDNGYNIMGGYHNDCVGLFRELIKVLARKRKQGKDFKFDNSFDYIKLFSDFYKYSEVEFINKKCILTPEEFDVKNSKNSSLVDVLNLKSSTVIISWMDTTHQCYVMAALITILTTCFEEPFNSPQVQFLTRRTISFMSFLTMTSEAPRSIIKCAFMMIQWPMLVAGMNCMDEDGKFILMKFFRFSSQVGSGGASYALKRISNIWSRHDKGLNDSESEDDKAVDLVSY